MLSLSAPWLAHSSSASWWRRIEMVCSASRLWQPHFSLVFPWITYVPCMTELPILVFSGFWGVGFDSVIVVIKSYFAYTQKASVRIFGQTSFHSKFLTWDSEIHRCISQHPLFLWGFLIMVTLYIFYSSKGIFWTTLFIFVADSPSAHNCLLFPHLESTAGGIYPFPTLAGAISESSAVGGEQKWSVIPEGWSS